MSKKFRAAKLEKNLGNIKSRIIPDNSLIQFSFKYLDSKNANFNYSDKNCTYYCNVIDRLRELSRTTAREFRTIKGHKSLRRHTIDWGDSRVTENSFGIPQKEEFDDDAWQFSISQNEAGRIHGALIENIFFVIWIDPEHNLYK